MKRERFAGVNKQFGVSYANESSVPTTFNFDFEGSNADDKPRRILDNFKVQDDGGKLIPFEELDKLLGIVRFFGDVIMIDDHSKRISVEFRFHKSMFGFSGRARGIWVESDAAWYKLRDPCADYEKIFETYDTKADCIIRLWCILWDLNQKGSEVTIETVKNHYDTFLEDNDIKDQTFEEIYPIANFLYPKLEEFITNDGGMNDLMKSPFMKELKKKVTDPSVFLKVVYKPPPPAPPKPKEDLKADPSYVPDHQQQVQMPPPRKRQNRSTTAKSSKNNKRKRVKHDNNKRQKKRKKKKRFHFYNEHHRFQNPYWREPNPKIEEFTLLKNRILRDSCERMDCSFREVIPYEEINSTLEWEKRRQFLLLVEFLTQVVRREELHSDQKPPIEPKYRLLFIGGAPGDHIPFLSELFHNVKFVCYDEKSFTIKPKKSKQSRLEIFARKNFSDFTHLYSAKKRDHLQQQQQQQEEEEEEEPKLLLFSCYRSDPEKSNDTRTIQRDLDVQKKWVTELRPYASMVLFNLPIYDDNYYDEDEGDDVIDFLDGHMFLPVWGPKSTRECHLYISPKAVLKNKQYRIKKHEEQMMYFCNITRSMYFGHNCVVQGMDHCYDCRSEILILEEYIRKFWVEIYNIKDKRRENIRLLSERISREISANRTLENNSVQNIVEIPKYLPERLIDNRSFDRMLDEI